MDLKEMPAYLFILTAIGVLIGVGITILYNIETSSMNAVTVSDETFNSSGRIAGTWVTLTNSRITPTSASFENKTGGNVYPTSWFEFNNDDKYSASQVRLTAAGLAEIGINESLVNVTYTYGQVTTSSTGIANVQSAVDDFPTWLAIIVIVIAAGVIIGLVTKSFTGR